MELMLSDEEADTLRRALGSYLSDLRMEIRDTERFEMRKRLKRDKAQLNALLDRLPPELHADVGVLIPNLRS